MMRFHLSLLFAVMSMANMLIYNSWKFLHHSIPKIPYRSVWPNYGICFCQIFLIAMLGFYGWSYWSSESTEDGHGFQIFKDYADRNEDNFKLVREELAKIEYPSYHQVHKELPSDMFLLNTRHQALKIMKLYSITGEMKFSSFTDAGCGDALSSLINWNRANFNLFAPFNWSLDQSIADWNKVVGEQKKAIKGPMNVEKRSFERHLARTVTMTEDVVLYWSSAAVMLRSFMLALTRYENELFVLAYTAPAILCLFYAFWAGYISLFCTHTPLDSMWRIIMKWLFYIGSGLALVLALYQIYLGTVVPSCQPVPNEFHKVRIPAFFTDTEINNAQFFSKCAQRGQTMFGASNDAILMPRSSLSANVAVALKNVASPIFSTIPELDEIVANLDLN